MTKRPNADPLSTDRSESAGLRERKKERTKRQLQAVAMQLFEEKGFETTTVEEIAAAAEVSPRTVFRYFPTKQDLVFGDWVEQLAELLELVESRPTSEAPLAAACSAVIEANARLDDELTSRATGLMARSRLLHSHSLELRHQWLRAVAKTLSKRGGKRDVEPLEWIAAGIALGIMDGAVRIWHHRGSPNGKIRETTAEMVGLVWQLTAADQPAAASSGSRRRPR